MILTQFKPDSDGFGRVVLEQHRNAANAAGRESLGKSTAHDHVARVVNLAKKAGVPLASIVVRGAKTDATVGSDVGASISILSRGQLGRYPRTSSATLSGRNKRRMRR